MQNGTSARRRGPAPAAVSAPLVPFALLALVAPMAIGAPAAGSPCQAPPPPVDDVVKGDDDLRTEAPPAYVLDARRMRRAFMDLLGRPPMRAERETWAGRGLRELLDEVVGSEEFWLQWREEQLYYFFLIDNFRPRSERILTMPGDLSEGRIGVRDAIHRIALCSSFDQRNPGADTFVTVVMEQLLGITVQKDKRELEIGKTLYDGGQGKFLGKRGNSQADVVEIAVQDKRFLRRYLEREYRRLLRAEPSAKEVKAWTKQLDRRPYAYGDILKEWMLSPAYGTRLDDSVVQPNRLFVRTLFVDLLDRLPDVDESRRMRDALDGLSDPGPLRSVLARLLIDSGKAPLPGKASISDPTEWIGGLFERFLGRSASPEELKAFVSAFHEPSCRPSTVVYALISHPEYHQF